MNEPGAVVSETVLQPLYRLEEELEDALNSGQGYKIIGQSLSKLEQYSYTHIESIRQRLTASHSTDSAYFDTLYSSFRHQVDEWISEYSDGANILSAEILHFIQNWLSAHRHLARAV